MKKIAVYIADQQYSRLKLLAQALGVKQAELLRQCLEDGLARIEEERLHRVRASDRGTPGHAPRA
jgi:predicted DNA-binding protein